MADAGIAPRPAPSDWGEAFAALPLEHAPSGGWSRIVAHVPRATAPRTAPRRRAWQVAVMAATIAVALPIAWRLTGESSVPAPIATASAPVNPRTDAAMPAATTAQVIPRATPPASPDLVAATATPSPALGVDDPLRPASPPMSRRGDATRMKDVAAHVATSDGAGTGDRSATPATTSKAGELDALRDESARLEALVAYARDETMASAPAAVMTAAVDDRLRLIDAALSQPGADDTVLASLWRERVDALQELAALEGTRRWMAVHGASMDTVVRID